MDTFFLRGSSCWWFWGLRGRPRLRPRGQLHSRQPLQASCVKQGREALLQLMLPGTASPPPTTTTTRYAGGRDDVTRARTFWGEGTPVRPSSRPFSLA